jgi:hypothetical protein
LVSIGSHFSDSVPAAHVDEQAVALVVVVPLARAGARGRSTQCGVRDVCQCS